MKVFRLLIYEGSAKWIEQVLEHNYIAEGIREFDMFKSITSITLGSMPNALSIEVQERPKYSYEDLKQLLNEFELVAVEYSQADIAELYDNTKRELLSALKEVCDAGS